MATLAAETCPQKSSYSWVAWQHFPTSSPSIDQNHSITNAIGGAPFCHPSLFGVDREMIENTGLSYPGNAQDQATPGTSQCQ